MNKIFTFAICGAGGRGQLFSEWLSGHPEAGKVVAVAEPDVVKRRTVAELHQIPENRQFESWEALLEQPQMADAIINTTMDRLHVCSAIKAMEVGYHMLLEKPMATTYEDCLAIHQARQRFGRIFCICHTMRYHRTYMELKRLVDSGAIGELVTFDHLEPVNPYHMAHSFVRGNWGNEARSSFMLLAKNCHDLDLIAHMVGRRCQRVSSFGSLSYFHEGNAPADAPTRCIDGCPIETECPYSALKFYLQRDPRWPSCVDSIPGKTLAERMECLKTGPYGRCVFRCDNDVVDHQVVNFEFDGGITGTFTMTAFRDHGVGRLMRLHGTKGFLLGAINENRIEWLRYSDNRTATIQLPDQEGSHGGGDHNLMLHFIDVLRGNDPERVGTGSAESLASHAIVFAAERARREKRVVSLSEFKGLDA